MGGRPDHRVPRRRQRDRARGRAGAARRSSPISRSSGTADDYDSLIAGAEAAAPQVLVTDIRMPPSFQREGIDAAKELRKRHPGTGVVVLSQYDDPDYAIALLGDGAAGYAYLLKDRVAEGDQLARAVREVATGGSVLDPKIVEALVQPVTDDGGLTAADERAAARGRRGPADQGDRRARRARPPAAVADVGRAALPQALGGREHRHHRRAASGCACLHQAIVDREEQGEPLSRLLPGGLAEKVRSEGRAHRRDRGARGHRAHGRHPRLLRHRRASDPTQLARQLSEHRAEMNHAILDEDGTVMQFVGDAVMACFGAPVPLDDHADRAVAAARAMIERQRALNERVGGARVDAPFGLGHRGVDRAGRGGAARLGGAGRVHARGRHREPGATAAGSGAAGRARS